MKQQLAEVSVVGLFVLTLMAGVIAPAWCFSTCTSHARL
jgi:hypothetical protein